MTNPTQTTIRCPNCGQPVQVQVRTIVDAQSDPQGKSLLMSGRLNSAQCLSCRSTASVVAPLLYHDGSKDLLIAYVPVEMGLQGKQQQEKIVGDLLNTLTNRIPKEQFRAYLFNPRRALTMQGVMDQILEADGISPEMMAEQKKRIDLIQEFLDSSSEEELLSKIAANDPVIDERLMQTLTLMIQRLVQESRREVATALLGLQEALLTNSSLGQSILEEQAQQEEAMRELAARLDELGDGATRQSFLELALEYASSDQHLQALVGMVRPALDYQFFQLLASAIDQAEAEEAAHLQSLRDHLVQLTEQVDREMQRSTQRAVDFLKYLLSLNPVEAISAALEQNANLIDDQFMAVVSANIQESERRGDSATRDRLREVYEQSIGVLQSQMTPELRFLNELMSIDDSSERRRRIQQQAPHLGAGLDEMIGAVQDMLRSQGQDDAIERLDAIRLELAQTGI